MDVGNVSCWQCERQIDDSLTWCPYCGAEQRTSQTSAGAPAQRAGEHEGQPDAAPGDPLATAAESSPSSGWAGAAVPDAASKPGPSRMAIIGLALLAVAGAAAAWFLWIRDDHRGDLSLFDTAAGDCWNDPGEASSNGQLATVSQVPCEEAHTYEVYAVVDLPGDAGAAYPGDTAVAIEGSQLCRDRFEAYIGIPYEESPLDSGVVYPTSESWSEGDREVICSVYALDGDLLTGSKRSSGDRLVAPAVDIGGAADCGGLADLAIIVAQGYIDYFESLTPEELDAGFDIAPPEVLPLYKSESLLIAGAEQRGCGLEDLNILFTNRTGSLTSTTEIGALLEEDYVQYGFFSTG